MGATDKAGFVQRRGDVHAAIKQAVEQLVEAGAVGLEHGGVVLGQLGQQEEAEHAALAVGAEGHAFVLGGLGQPIDQ